MSSVRSVFELMMMVHRSSTAPPSRPWYAPSYALQTMPATGGPETTLRAEHTRLDQASDAVKSLYNITTAIDELSSSYPV
jgi:hypothetical protein